LYFGDIPKENTSHISSPKWQSPKRPSPKQHHQNGGTELSHFALMYLALFSYSQNRVPTYF